MAAATLAAFLAGLPVGRALVGLADRLLRGRAIQAEKRPWRRAGAVEVLTGALFALTVLALGVEPELAGGLAFVCLLVVVAIVDLEARVIPNVTMLVGAAVALAPALILDPASLPERVIAASAAGGALLVVALAKPRGMGIGDVKLAAVAGLFLGASVAVALFVACLAGSVVGLLLVAVHGKAARERGLPFGPFLAIGGVVGLLAGEQAIDWYLRLGE